MPIPSNTKYRKPFLGKKTTLATSYTQPNHGLYAIKTVASKIVPAESFDAFRKAINKQLKNSKSGTALRGPNFEIVFTSKALGCRGGGGKGSPDGNAYRTKRGGVITEVSGCSLASIEKFVQLASKKLPVQVKICKRKYSF
jgi:ribosomal protein L16/L10AE